MNLKKSADRSSALDTKHWAPILFLMVASVALTGCFATRTQVQEIVDRSNKVVAGFVARSTLDSMGGIALADKADDSPAWRIEVDRIEAFILEHPDAPATTAPLRLRQAMILAQAKQRNLARAVFDLVEPANLHSDRDKTLVKMKTVLPWWYAVDLEDLTEDDVEKADEALQDIAGVLDDPHEGPKPDAEVRAFAEEMRARIALQVGKKVTDQTHVAGLFKNGLNRFADTLDDEDLGWIKDYSETEDYVDETSTFRVLKKRLAAVDVAVRYKRAIKGIKERIPDFNPEFNARANRLISVVKVPS